MLAGLAPFNVGLYIPFEFRPPVFAEYQLLRLLDTWMAGCDVIMAVRNDFAPEGGLPRDIDLPIIL